LAETFRGMGDDADPRRVERRAAEVRRDAERELLAALARHRRPQAQAVLRFAHTFVPLRETGKAALMTAFDVARLSARSAGAHLARSGVLADPEDVFLLTMDELAAPPVPDVRELVAFRRERRERYQQLDLPESWVGMVEPIPAAEASGDRVTGLGVSPGVTEGRARVVADPSTDDLEPGEILVCETTDPSWAAYFLVAAGVVNDIGSAMSHGSIVAREVGIPCVTNTRNGTRVLRTGDLVRVDGVAGTVDVLSRAAS
jgi:pyruvate,water dikinase